MKLPRNEATILKILAVVLLLAWSTLIWIWLFDARASTVHPPQGLCLDDCAEFRLYFNKGLSNE